MPTVVKGHGVHRRLSVCVFFCTIFQLGPSKLTHMSPRNQFIFGSKCQRLDQGRESQNSAGVGLCTLVTAGVFYFVSDIFVARF